MIIVGTSGIGVDAVGDRQQRRAIHAPECRAETDPIDAGTAVAMIQGIGDVAIEAPVAVHVGGIVARDLRQMDRAHEFRRFRVDTDAVDPVSIDDGDVEGFVGLVFERTVDLAVVRIEIEIAKMSGPADQGANQLAVEVVSGQQVGERVIDVSALHIYGDALHVSGWPGAAVLRQRRLRRGSRGDGAGLRTGGRPQHQHDAQQHSGPGETAKGEAGRRWHGRDRTWANRGGSTALAAVLKPGRERTAACPMERRRRGGYWRSGIRTWP